MTNLLTKRRYSMNVALTRAKELLVVVGNGNLLKRDPYWKSFLQFVLRHDLYVTHWPRRALAHDCTRYMGPQLDLEADGNYISRLEYVGKIWMDF